MLLTPELIDAGVFVCPILPFAVSLFCDLTCCGFCSALQWCRIRSDSLCLESPAARLFGSLTIQWLDDSVLFRLVAMLVSMLVFVAALMLTQLHGRGFRVTHSFLCSPSGEACLPHLASALAVCDVRLTLEAPLHSAFALPLPSHRALAASPYASLAVTLEAGHSHGGHLTQSQSSSELKRRDSKTAIAASAAASAQSQQSATSAAIHWSIPPSPLLLVQRTSPAVLLPLDSLLGLPVESSAAAAVAVVEPELKRADSNLGNANANAKQQMLAQPGAQADMKAAGVPRSLRGLFGTRDHSALFRHSALVSAWDAHANCLALALNCMRATDCKLFFISLLDRKLAAKQFLEPGVSTQDDQASLGLLSSRELTIRCACHVAVSCSGCS